MNLRMSSSPKIYLTLLFSISILGLCLAQGNGAASDFWNRVRFGGGIGLGFANNIFNASVSPSGIYQANENFATGVGLNFNYAKFNDDKFIAYGASFMNFYNPIPAIQLSAEMEQWRVSRRQSGLGGGTAGNNYWTSALFLGIGYSTRNVTVGLRYDVLYDDAKSIYIDPLMPFFRVYF